MALISCQECGNSVSDKAKACPNCGAKPSARVGIGGKIFVLLVGLFFAAVIAGGLRDTSKTSSSSEGLVAPKPAVSAAERKRIIADATQHLEESRDKFEKISFYNPKKTNVLSSRLEPYISVPDGSAPILRMYVVYSGEDWVFFKGVKVLADDAIVYDHIPEKTPSRQNHGGTVWESADYAASASDVEALRRIMRAKSVTIRFSGQDRQDEHIFTRQELENIRQVLAAFDAMSTL